MEEHEEAFESILTDLYSIIIDARVNKVILGADFNFEFNNRETV